MVAEERAAAAAEVATEEEVVTEVAIDLKEAAEVAIEVREEVETAAKEEAAIEVKEEAETALIEEDLKVEKAVQEPLVMMEREEEVREDSEAIEAVVADQLVVS
jgi:hypothetical protein